MQKFLNTTNRNIIWFKRTFDAQELEMRPPFQRNPVWTERQQSYLIDSILQEFPIPELYMQEIVTPEGKQRHVVVDGQQRINACLQFMEGVFALDGDMSPRYADMTFEDLLSEDKKRLYEYSFVVRMLPDMPEENLRGIFQRLNRSTVNLTPQELRHATYWGPFIKLVEALAEHEFWTESGIFSPNDIRRMGDVEFMSELVVAMLHGHQNKKQSLGEWYQVYEKSFEAEETVRSAFLKVLGEIDQLLPNIAKTRWRKKSDFYSLFLVLHDQVPHLPFASERRDLVAATLHAFGTDVTAALKKGDGTSSVTPQVLAYAAAVDRAASDLANRRSRHKVLSDALGFSVETAA